MEMLGHRDNEGAVAWRSGLAGYDGFISTPCSPTKYTVNNRSRAARRNMKGHYAVSKLCILSAAIAICLFLILMFIIAYFAIPCKCNTVTRQREAFTFTEENEDSVRTELPIVVKNLTHDQFEIGNDFKNDDTDDDEDLPATEEMQTVADEQVQIKVENVSVRLPRDIIPTHYRIKIVPFMEDDNMTTSGYVNITIICLNPTRKIVMNLKDIEVRKDVKISEIHNGDPVAVEKFDVDNENEIFTIYLKEYLVMDEEYHVLIWYTGKIRSLSNGLYRSYFTDLKTHTRTAMVNTLLSPTYARYVYPSFDEPSFKAKFTISIGRREDMFSLSNMKIKRITPMSKANFWVWDHYGETPLMSTYLTAFLVAPISSLEKIVLPNSVDPEISLWTRPYNSYQAEFGTKVSGKVLKFFEQYFSIKFPLSKIDIVAVPAHDYEAMENWGLIIFKEDNILVDKGNSIRTQQTLAFTLAHEIAHQWFGNLVTPKWWNELWLKEGFSSYFQYLAIDNIYPDWKAFKEFLSNEMDMAFMSDALTTSHPISTTVDKPNSEIFNVVSYHKGSSIIRMMAHFLGAARLQQGLTAYLDEYAYGNAQQEELWKFLGKGGITYDKGKLVELSTIMDTWTKQAGYPVVTVTRNYQDGSVEISQERFLLNGSKNSSSLWWVPISYTTKQELHFNDTLPKLWLAAEEKIVIPNFAKKDSWVLFNLQNTGFYRVNYDTNNWILLIEYFNSFPNDAKYQLIKDSFYLARSGNLPYEYALSLGGQLTKEVEYMPWQAATQVLLYLKDMLTKMPAYGNFKAYVLVMISKAYRAIGAELTDNNSIPWVIPDNPIPQMHAENIIKLSCMFHDGNCVNNARGLFKHWMDLPDDGNIIPVVIRPLIYCTAIKEGDRSEWEFAYQRFLIGAASGSKYDSEQSNLITALGCSSKQWLLTKALGLIMDPNSGLNEREGMLLFRSVAANDLGHWIAVSFVHSQWKLLLETYQTPNVIYQMVQSIVSYINSPYEIDQLKALVYSITNHTQKASEALTEALEMAENNKLWMEKNYRSVDRWLDSFVDTYRVSY
ncbi:aminopeptidase N-like [Arctopsyche grandis]|uniref:aminopeptidase N-like n=1 Tax=Arctopsyche grandis TaxID=121162 RepID=UPI00406D68F1